MKYSILNTQYTIRDAIRSTLYASKLILCRQSSAFCTLSTVNCHLSTVLFPLHLSRSLYKSAPFMQNKPNFRKARMNVSSFITKDYRKNDAFAVQKNKPNQTQFPQRDTQYAIRDTKYKPNQTQSFTPLFRVLYTLRGPAPVFTPKTNITPEKQPQKILFPPKKSIFTQNKLTQHF